MKPIKDAYRRVFQFMRGPLAPFLKNTALAFLSIYFISLAASLLFPTVQETMISFMDSVSESADIVNADGSISAFAIFINNFRASLLCILYGIIPFIFFPAFPIGLNSSMLGSMTAFYMTHDRSMLLLLAGILPHGIIEIPALVISLAAGLYLCHEITYRIRTRSSGMPIGGLFISLIRLFFLILVPMLFIASLVEAKITPICMLFFM